MKTPREAHLEGAYRVLAYIKKAHVEVFSFNITDIYALRLFHVPVMKKSHDRYCSYVGGNLITWQSQKQKSTSQV